MFGFPGEAVSAGNSIADMLRYPGEALFTGILAASKEVLQI